MKTKELIQFLDLEEGKDYEEIGAKEFEKLAAQNLKKHGQVETQVLVNNRGDGRRGRIDIVFTFRGERFGIEIDRKTPRAKSRFKIKLINPEIGFLVTRSPFRVVCG